MKKIFAFLCLLNSAFSMETALIVDTPALREAFTGDFQYYAPHLRFLNNQIVSNLRFIKTQQQIDFNYPPHRQENPHFFPIDSMTQIVHHLFPSPTGDYLVVNQTRDIIGTTPLLNYRNALYSLKQNPDISVWDIFSILFSRTLLSSARHFVESNVRPYNISSLGYNIFKLTIQHGIKAEEAKEHILKYLTIFEEEFFKSREGKLFKDALRKNNLFNEKVSRQINSRINFLEGQINCVQNKIKKSQFEDEIQAIQNLSESYLTPQDFDGYCFAYAFREAFLQQKRGEYEPGTLDRVLSVYSWQKANTPEELPVLINPVLNSTREISNIIKSITSGQTSLQDYYNRGEYDIIWSYIYRERLMLDTAQVPLTKYRSVSIDNYSFSDCFETSLRNTTNYLCFQNGCFNPGIWKEHSRLRRYYNEFSHTNPNDPNARTAWTDYASKIPQVLYYTPSKKINNPTNTHEAIPGIFNMMRILSNLGEASEAILLQINQLYEKFETITPESLATLFSHLVQDITESKINLTTFKIENLEPLQNRSNTYQDYKGDLHFQLTDQTPSCLEFQAEHAVFRFQKSMTADTQTTQIIEPHSETLSKLPLFEDLKTEYTNKLNLLQSATCPEEVIALLMRFDLQSPDIRQEILPTLLNHHANISLIKGILASIEEEHDIHEITFVNNIFQQKIIEWLSDNIQKENIISLIQYLPNIFNCDTIRFLLQQDNEQYSEWDIYLLSKVHSYTFSGENDPVFEHIATLRNIKILCCVPFINSKNEFFKLDDFKHIDCITIYHIIFPHTDHNTILSQIPNWVQTLPQTLEEIHFSGHKSDSNYLPFALAIKEALEQHGRNSIDFVYSKS